jgi:putative ABC transport system permease protein
MLKNYFKIAIAVLKRHKFFTFISLFGISVTLCILMVGTAFIDKVISADYPDMKRDRCLYINSIELKNSKEGWMNKSLLSFHVLHDYMGSLKIPEKVAISSQSSATNTYVNNKKIVVDYKYTNREYWDVMDYSFLEGKPYTQQQIEQAQHVAVISEDLKKQYFGTESSVLGRDIEADNVKYKVIGVVANVSKTLIYSYANLYLPYTVSKVSYKSTELMGGYCGVLLARSKEDVPKMQAEYDQMVKKIPIGTKEFDQLFVPADPYLAAFTRNEFGNETSTGVSKVMSILAGFALVFMLLPTISLVNINITRIMERSSEIGVRKAFGASSKTLVYQFIIENIILTCIGGLIGLVLSVIAIYLINTADVISNLNLTLNLRVLGYSFIACLFFGLLSGVYPAWRMSRLNVVSALKAQ